MRYEYAWPGYGRIGATYAHCCANGILGFLAADGPSLDVDALFFLVLELVLALSDQSVSLVALFCVYTDLRAAAVRGL